MDKNYLYRIDQIRTLKFIQKEGFRCGSPSRITHLGLKSETEQALEQGLRIPPEELVDCPRGYFFETLQYAEFELDCYTSYDFISRYSRKYMPFSSDDMIFPDGAWRNGAVYVIFENAQVDDPVVPPENIDVLIQGKWRSLRKFKFESLKYLKCSCCRNHIPKKIVKKKGYKGKWRGETFYCESCSCRRIVPDPRLVALAANSLTSR